MQHAWRFRSHHHRELRDALEVLGYRVFEVAATQLEDHDAVRAHFRRLARALGKTEEAERLRADEWSWPAH